ncbi:TRAP transporter small permease [Poseidonocella sedimentorum]|uniref:TRAP transporter small permease protein n=1 Tax=Poseidonocella sedimentorum TaxID=871652 RepID=A0A1I6DLZ7_9RHOB|nr:TRAP transporter small permease [Poseidonocella sedimentorum]SFR06388.1 TRAP-type C4-dicarboxylate transport system, small permease component [Poseidonocella sedimentorum]
MRKLVGLVEESCLLAAFWALGLAVFAQFFFRYFLNMPLGWTEELARYLMISVAFLGLPVVTRRGEHIAIDMFVGLMPAGARPWFESLAEIIQIVIIGTLAWQAWALAQLSGQAMSTLPLPKSVIYYIVFTGLVLNLAATVLRLSDRLQGAPLEGRP